MSNKIEVCEDTRHVNNFSKMKTKDLTRNEKRQILSHYSTP